MESKYFFKVIFLWTVFGGTSSIHKTINAAFRTIIKYLQHFEIINSRFVWEIIIDSFHFIFSYNVTAALLYWWYLRTKPCCSGFPSHIIIPRVILLMTSEEHLNAVLFLWGVSFFFILTSILILHYVDIPWDRKKK